MRNKFQNRALVTLLLGGTGLLVLSVLIVFGLSQRSARPVSTGVPAIVTMSTASPKPAPPAVNRGLPARLIIPKLKVDASTLYMGLTKTGAMATPDNVVDVGWYKYGPLPGNTGSAVIAGHIDGLRGEPGVFSKLDTLRAGDTLSVIDTADRATDFVVREVRTYGQDEQPTEVFNSSQGAHLNLITCTGAWDATQHHFLKRLVVFTDKSV